MTGLRDLLKKKERIQEAEPAGTANVQPVPEFTFLRTTTNTVEQIEPPENQPPPTLTRRESKSAKHFSRPFSIRHHFHTSQTSVGQGSENEAHHGSQRQDGDEPSRQRRLSDVIHRRGRSRSKSDASSVHVPSDLGAAPPLPAISVTGTVDQDQKQRDEARWERRATLLATNGPLLDGDNSQHSPYRDRSASISDAQGDVSIQEAIRLHESGDLARSTRMFGQLADPDSTNNALSQILYGLALRHGWGVQPDPRKAIHFLSLAAKNSADVESQALATGMVKGGAAKGELVLAIFELANCFRNGMGVDKDPVAARQYYDTAANLGDTDAMAEAAWCYLEGFGGPKDKFKAAQYLRLAEAQGVKTVGNSWIWKEKYNRKEPK